MTFTSPVSGPTSGPIVGGYRLLARIGEGGMGVVHVAEGRDGRRVALKVLRPHVVGDEEARQRLAREVASLRQVHSPHVAEVLDADPWGETPYIVTRYVPGHSLHETVLRDGPLPATDLGHVGRRLLEAVGDVHAADVLHRDLKPTNVVMEGRSPILIDFGLARLVEDPRLTVAGFLLGTPGYLAPEMLFGDAATAATDVHGWAATMVYAATGRSPYGAGHTMAVLDRTRRGEADLRGVPDVIRPLLQACLSLEPLDRPSIYEVSSELAGLSSTRLPRQTAQVSDADEAPDGSGSEDVASAVPLTMPWPLVAAEPAATEVIPQARAAGSAMPEDAEEPSTVVQPVADPLTRPYTVVAPKSQPAPMPTRVQPGPVGGPPPAYIAPTPTSTPWPPPGHQPARPTGAAPAAQPSGQPGRLTGWGRLRRGLALLFLGGVVTVLFAAAPYLTSMVLAVAVVLLRGAAFAQQAAWRRRMAHGRRWSDGPTTALGYPWHVLRGSVGSVFLLLTAAVLAASAVAACKVLGLPDREALLAGGVASAAVVWWGPGSQRVRLPVSATVTAVVRQPLAGWAVLVLLVGLLLGGWVTGQSGASWSPAPEAPWSSVDDLIPPELRVPEVGR